VNHAVGPGGTGAECGQIGKIATKRLGAGGLEGRRGRVGAGEREDGVAAAEQFGDDSRADAAGAAGDEDVHVSPLSVMGLLSHHHSRVMG
jgi:hypothetical protein